MVRPAPLGGELPDDHQTRGALDKAVDAEAEQRDGAREQGGRNTDAAFDQVPALGQVLQLQGAAQDEGTSVDDDAGIGHVEHSAAAVGPAQSKTASCSPARQPWRAALLGGLAFYTTGMFLGHFAVGLAARRITPRVSLGTFFAAAQLLDLIWPALVLPGVERVRVDPGNTQHRLHAARFRELPVDAQPAHGLLWATGFALICQARTGFSRGAWVVGALVLSHWALDCVGHRPDLPLAPSGNGRGHFHRHDGVDLNRRLHLASAWGWGPLETLNVALQVTTVGYPA